MAKSTAKKPDAIQTDESVIDNIDELRVIELLDDYSGRPSGEKIIKAGLYLETDRRLVGKDGNSLADYFLEKQFAVERDEFSEKEKMVLYHDSQKKPKAVKERDGFRGHVEPTEQLNGAPPVAPNGLLPPPETAPLARTPARERPTPVTPVANRPRPQRPAPKAETPSE